MPTWSKNFKIINMVQVKFWNYSFSNFVNSNEVEFLIWYLFWIWLYDDNFMKPDYLVVDIVIHKRTGNKPYAKSN